MMERKLAILYGSQTGTAQDLAEQIWRESKMFHFCGTVQSMDDYDVRGLIDEKFVVFVCATTGQGEEPDNMKTFWKFLLRKSLPPTSLGCVQFCVLGLGDSSYTKFNFVAKRLNKRLMTLGARQMIPVGLCDDQHDLGLSAVATPWIKDLWVKLEVLCPLANGLRKLDQSPRMFKWNVRIMDEDKENDESMSSTTDDLVFVDSRLDRPFEMILEANTKTTDEQHFQDVRLLSFCAPDAEWVPGDVLQCRPWNSQDKVDQLFDLFAVHGIQLFPETVVQIQPIDEIDEMPVPSYLQQPMTLKTLAKQYWDLSAVPRPRAFEVLALNCDDELEREKCNEFLTPEGQEDFYSYVNRPRRTILEVLLDFRYAAAALNVQKIFEIFQPIKPRSFSIASCQETGKLELLVAVVQYKTVLSTPRLGLCSNWMRNLAKGDRVRAWIRRGTFTIPNDNSTPLIMVGPGTGLAPFRSLLLEREIKLQESVSVPLILFFGCRNEKRDFHCHQDLRRMEATGLLILDCAFSRDQTDKVYVQHRIKSKALLLRQLIRETKAVILVAGNSKNMPTSVREAFVEILDNDEAFFDSLIKTGRYQEETWG